MTDIWLPRMYLMAEVALLIVSGILICLGHDSTVTDLFCASGGALTAHTLVTKLRTPSVTSPTSDQ